MMYRVHLKPSNTQQGYERAKYLFQYLAVNDTQIGLIQPNLRPASSYFTIHLDYTSCSSMVSFPPVGLIL